MDDGNDETTSTLMTVNPFLCWTRKHLEPHRMNQILLDPAPIHLNKVREAEMKVRITEKSSK